MTRNLKVLGLTISAILVLGAIAASAASATVWHSSVQHTVFKGSGQGEVFTIDAGTFECGSSIYEGTAASATNSTISITAAYSECTATFGLNITFDMNGCQYTLNTATFPASPTTDIHCPEGKVIEITAPGCTITIPTQTGITSYTATNSNPRTDVLLHTNLTGIKYEEHDKGFFPTCEDSTVAKSNGTLNGTATYEGSNTVGAMVQIWHE